MRAVQAIRNQPLFALLVLLLIAALALGLGIGQPTGLTGKDEYLLGLRIPLEMMQRDAWWVPFIDGAPRLKKPPFIYWIGRASFESFGPSLLAARAITVTFALLLTACTAWLGKRLVGSWQVGLLAAGVLLGISGMASESRRLMLDVPVAALSTAAFCLYLGWLDSLRASDVLAMRSMLRMAAAGLCLSAALMTKGPIGVIAFGAGWVALLTDPAHRASIKKRWPAHLLLAGIAIALPLAWYLSVHQLYAAQLATAAHDELEARQFPVISADALIGLSTLALPWTFIALHSLWMRRREPVMRFLGLWLLCSLLPFLFIRVFERYLIGSLVPLSLMAAIALQAGTTARWTHIVGSLLPTLLAGALAILLWRFDLGGWPWLIPVLAWFVWTWWRRDPRLVPLLGSAILLWTVGWGIAFPRLGVNAVPPEVVTLARGRDVLLFAGPQPALLPILVKSPLHQTSQIHRDDLKKGSLIALRLADNELLQTQLMALGIQVREVGAFATLASSGSGIRFAREQATWADWRQVWRERSLAGLKTRIVIFEVPGP